MVLFPSAPLMLQNWQDIKILSFLYISGSYGNTRNMKHLFYYLITHLPLYHFFSDFIRCGITGWCLEIVFTAFHSFRKREMSLKGTTSIWMFPIYGSIALLKPLFYLLRQLPIWIRGLLYASCIFTGEYISGQLLAKHCLCPWNYSRSKWHIQEVIRLDFLPYWFLTGLLFERLLTKKVKK